MTVQVPGIDRALLARAGRVLGAADDTDAVNRALAAAVPPRPRPEGPAGPGPPAAPHAAAAERRRPAGAS